MNFALPHSLLRPNNTQMSTEVPSQELKSFISCFDTILSIPKTRAYFFSASSDHIDYNLIIVIQNSSVSANIVNLPSDELSDVMLLTCSLCKSSHPQPWHYSGQQPLI